ncbi:YiiD C-terminal domain-containing protein [Solimonas soli]|uniref:YiiD C-terminal domain-containing protein n=1 Tax=Solimonas soli TaxID=413479 RepID=UPI0004835C25|nr:YiiD C-terminal domain-containing protein [Solimonas soli]
MSDHAPAAVASAATPADLTAFLHEQIPLTAAMSLRVTHADEAALAIDAPLTPNRNPHGTVFGGSLATLAIVAGWTLLYRALGRSGLAAALVIQHVECDYLAPADRAFRAAARLPEAWPHFLETLRAKGRARCEVAVQLFCDGRLVLTAKARYAARL